MMDRQDVSPYAGHRGPKASAFSKRIAPGGEQAIRARREASALAVS